MTEEVKRIDKLTPEQEALLPKYHKWATEVTLDTTPADKPRAEKAFKAIYSVAGLPEPNIYWASSPFEALEIYRRESGDKTGVLPGRFSGQHDSGWAAWWTYFNEVLGYELPERVDMWREVALSCGWWYAFRGSIIALDRYEQVRLDDQNRLHCEDGFAVKFRNSPESLPGGIFFWHGQHVPAKVIMAPESLTVEEIQKETNMEVQRIMVERYGPGKYMQDSGSKLLDADGGLGVLGSAPRALYEDATKQKWLVGTDGSTARVYYMAVPGEVQTCKEAHQAISGLKDETKCQCEC